MNRAISEQSSEYDAQPFVLQWQLHSRKMPRITRPQVYRVVREMLPRERFGPAELLRWLEDTQDSNERVRRSHAKRRAVLRASPEIPP